MEEKKILSRLKNLCQLDMDAIHAYEQAIESIEHQPIKEQIISFKEDHERHVDNLSSLMRNHGGTPPEFSRDFKGFFMEGFTKVRSATGTEGALKAMRGNEKLTNRKYEKALEDDLPADVLKVIRENREDERRHLQYIERMLEQKPWTEKGASPRKTA
jgi:uncharacterized protein (TIGR02284 family)